MTIYQQICQARQRNKKLFALLIDPGKSNAKHLHQILDTKRMPDYIFVGGSQFKESIEETVATIKSITNVPIVMFPGNAAQFATNIDALLFLSLASGRNAQYLIEQQIEAAPLIAAANIEAIPTGYILINGGKKSAVEYISNTTPYDSNNIKLITDTALACQYLGNKLIYLEAGSGAITPISQSIISATKSVIDVPLLVGGGIKNTKQITDAFNAGADLVVIGNHIENNPNDLDLFLQTINNYNNHQYEN